MNLQSSTKGSVLPIPKHSSQRKLGQPLRAKPRSKGNRGEKEAIEIFHAHGYPNARRNFQSGGQGGGDVVEGPPDFHWEVKYRERCSIWEWIEQADAERRATETPVVIFRRNRSPWNACLPFEDFLGLLDELRELRRKVEP